MIVLRILTAVSRRCYWENLIGNKRTVGDLNIDPVEDAATKSPLRWNTGYTGFGYESICLE